MFDGFCQIGFVTKDLEKSIRYFENTMGVPKFLTLKSPAIRNQTLYGEPIDIDVNLAFGQMGNTNVELIQPLKGGSTYNQMLDKYDWMGIHHLAIKTYDFDKTVNDLKSQGFAIAQTGETGVGTKFHYMDTVLAYGYFLEVLFFDLDYERIFNEIKRGDF